MNLRMFRCFCIVLCFLCVSLAAKAAENLPGGIKAGALLFEWPNAKSASENEWKLENSNEGHLKSSGTGLEVTSEQTNLILSCNAALNVPLVMRIGIRFDQTKNDWMYVQLFDHISLGFISKQNGFILRAKSSGTIYDDKSYEQLGVKEFDPEAKCCPAWPKITLTVALTSGRISVWCEGELLFQANIERFEIPEKGLLRIRSGWHSDWGLERVEVWKLEN